MDYNAFSNVLADIVLKRNIEIEYKALQQFDRKDKYKIRCDLLDNDVAFTSYKKDLYDCYSARRKELKKSLKMSERDKIDSHKIAAVVLYSILDLKPIKFSLHAVKQVDDVDDSVKLVNYRIAFDTACGIVYIDMLDALNKVKSNDVEIFENKERAMKQLVKHGQLFLPVARKEVGPYRDNYSKILYINDRIKKEPSDYLEIADTMFLLECFNWDCLGFHISDDYFE
ncbi:MAG: hypothetical protein J1G01_04600 [Clostridiales bacterium]|nr:hypothetical protein [Clostridiales bacterium]